MSAEDPDNDIAHTAEVWPPPIQHAPLLQTESPLCEPSAGTRAVAIFCGFLLSYVGIGLVTSILESQFPTRAQAPNSQKDFDWMLSRVVYIFAWLIGLALCLVIQKKSLYFGKSFGIGFGLASILYLAAMR